MSEPRFPLSLTSILIFMGIYLIALACLGITGYWTAFIVVAIVCAPVASFLWAFRARAMRAGQGVR